MTTAQDREYKYIHTCENVIEVLTFFILEANMREEMISEALEQRGVTTNDT